MSEGWSGEGPYRPVDGDPSGEIPSSRAEDQSSGSPAPSGSTPAIDPGEDPAPVVGDPPTLDILSPVTRAKISERVDELAEKLGEMHRRDPDEIEASRYFTHEVSDDWRVCVSVRVEIRKR